jgi:multidrug efflux pump subunit AcrA (membrane-fusion protein)
MKRSLIIGVGVVAIVAAAFWFIRSQVFPEQRISPRRGDVIESIYGLGSVTSDQVFHVRTGVSLAIRKLMVKEGDLVKSGDPLIQFDGAVMRSKISGTVTQVSYKEGELVPAQISVLTVTNLENLFLEISLEQQSILRVKANQKAMVSFESLRSESFEGVVKSVYPRESQFIVRIELSKWPQGVLPGMTADVAILVGKKSNVLSIPLSGISAGQVTRVRNGKHEKIHVKLGVIDGEWAEVTSDNIEMSDEIVSRK